MKKESVVPFELGWLGVLWVAWLSIFDAIGTLSIVGGIGPLSIFDAIGTLTAFGTLVAIYPPPGARLGTLGATFTLWATDAGTKDPGEAIQMHDITFKIQYSQRKRICQSFLFPFLATLSGLKNKIDTTESYQSVDSMMLCCQLQEHVPILERLRLVASNHWYRRD